ncbi:TPA: hypothetical protein ACGMXO_000016 [Streptococcus agalactiae]
MPASILTLDEIIYHLAFFVSRLWQIYVFGEGNTRTMAVFFPLHNRILHISGTFKEPEKANIETAKPDIDDLKPDTEKASIASGSSGVEWMGNHRFSDIFPQSEVLRRLGNLCGCFIIVETSTSTCFRERARSRKWQF